MKYIKNYKLFESLTPDNQITEDFFDLLKKQIL